ncbi:MAG: DUF4097 family beta strand repeat protein [Hamadaea sp.]|uniref:DUF4097 family beta strand repeat-containing protein n=1 Tax=Hamadaea sp. TaxID=2024425 RepID=UPI00183DCAEA|nr:DUF4097 family beta strand repeat-containing protein [Hamadaea sp.]NUR69643.1 DUF4097 family beta strand repeat protein [Hamadaea sp.]NUT23349.1 DUF4097 family beta strand repeat protein [Hamadaea sp.]
MSTPTEAVRPSRRWLTLGGLVTIVVVLAGASVAWAVVGGTGLNRVVESARYDRSITRLVFDDLESGDVTVRAKAGATGVSVQRTLHWTTQSPTIHEDWDGDVLTIGFDCPRWGFGSGCGVDYSVEVPPTVQVQIQVGSGDVRLAGLTAPARVHTTSGDVRISEMHADKLDVEATSGDLTFEDISIGTLSAATVSGDVRAVYTTSPASLEISAVSGDVNVTLPRDGTAYQVHLESTSGDLSTDVATTAGATARIDLSTTSGDVRVRLA